MIYCPPKNITRLMPKPIRYSQSDKNQQPPPCKDVALPIELCEYMVALIGIAPI